MSTVKIDSSTAKLMAHEALSRLLIARNHEVNAHLSEELERRNNGFFHKLFKLQPWTEAMLRAEYSRVEFNFENPIWMIEYDYEEESRLPLQVLKASSLGDIVLSLEDACALKRWAEL